MSDPPATAAPGPRLAALLRDHRKELLEQWIQRVRDDTSAPQASRLSEPDLNDHVPDLLESVTRDLDSTDGGEASGRAIGGSAAAREHARHRAAKGYKLEEALRELSHFRSAILDLCAKQGVILENDTARLLNGAIDESMSTGAAEMERVSGAERTRAAEEREQALESERAARSEAERAAHLRDEFVATVSHELRTPLNAILGWTAMLRGGKLDAAATARALEVVERNARAQADLVEDLLDVSRISSGKLRLDVRRVDLGAIVDHAVASHLPAAQAKGVRLHTAVDARASAIQGDPGRLEQIVSNLLSNAIKFTPRGGHVDVIVCRVGSRAELSVRDTGCGIPADFLPHVFDRFRQADASLTRHHRGLGLGLALVKYLTEQHGGDVRAESDGDGHGATFTVSLPIATIARADSGGPTPTEACDSLNGVKALVIDDEEDARALMRRILEECHAEVASVGSTAEALAELSRFRPDVLVSDIGMPELDGYHLIRAVRSLDPAEGGAIPAVAVTAFARPEDRLRALRAGFQMHLAKPVDPSELIVVVANLAGRRDGWPRAPPL